MSTPIVSVIIPCLNEVNHITRILNNVRSSTIPMDVIVIDGGSTDGTLEEIKQFQQTYPELILIHNPRKFVSFALNEGIKLAKGKYIARMDVHAQYPEQYLSTCLKIAENNPCDNVGGYVSFKGVSPTGKAIASALSSFWGIGYKIHDIHSFDHYTDTVHFGFWPKVTFEKYGTFDEELIRNQDEELNYRVTQSGGRIFKSASIVTELFVREKFTSLASQFFQYGYYKPLVIKKIGQIVRFRHLVPSLFLIYLVVAVLTTSYLTHVVFYPLYIYMMVSLYFAINQKENFSVKMLSFFTYPIIHISYGLGFIFGAFNIFFIRPFNKHTK